MYHTHFTHILSNVEKNLSKRGCFYWRRIKLFEYYQSSNNKVQKDPESMEVIDEAIKNDKIENNVVFLHY